MCRYRVFLKDKTHADPDKDRAGCWKRGMIPAVFDDSRVWGREESRDVWLNEARAIPCDAQAGLNTAVVQVKAGEVEVPGAMLNRLHGTQRCIQHMLTYIVIVADVPYEVTAAGGVELWKVLIENTPVEPLLPPGGYWEKGIFQRAVLLFDAPFDADTDALLVKNDPARWHGLTATVDVPGVPAEQMRELMAEQTEDDSGNQRAPEFGEHRSAYRRRRWVMRIDSMPPSIRGALENDGHYSFSSPQDVAQLRGALMRVRDNARFTGLD
jgi:hypothetical protein